MDSDYRSASKWFVEKLHNNTKPTFSDVIEDLYQNKNEQHKTMPPIISDFYHKIIAKNAVRLDAAIIHNRDYNYNYLALKTLEHSYLLKINGKIAERPQHMLMRVAIGIHGENIDAAIETYNLLSENYFTHSSPTLRTAVTKFPQLNSCFLLSMSDDSTEGIYDTVKQCAIISKYSGGIGLNVHCVRAKGTHIAGINGTSNGLLPMLRVFNNVARFVDQGGHKRPGAFSIYLEPWHADIFDFLNLKKTNGKEETRARDLSFGLWIPDLFMRRIEANADWCLMCPHDCPGLFDTWGVEFESLYEQYEAEGNYVRKIKAQTLWHSIIETQVETGMPFMLYKDACNRKSNQQNVGTIRCSNLCAEVILYSSENEIAVCNLASIALNKFVTTEGNYDFKKLKEITKIVTKNLNKIIDVTYYPLPESEKSNRKHRPIGIGIQGLADTFIRMRYPYVSEQAILLNQQIFETLYFGALEASCELAERDGPYECYADSPVSKGILQFTMWNRAPTDLWNWIELKEKITKFGVRNSVLIAATPTVATAQILGNSESFEPYGSFGYQFEEFQIINENLKQDLIASGLWNDKMQQKIIESAGSIQNIAEIPETIRNLYKTVWEIPLKSMIEMAVTRAPFIDQSQSFNLYVTDPNYGKLTSIHFYCWKLGLKTGMHYLRTKAKCEHLNFYKKSVSTTVQNGIENENLDEMKNKLNGSTVKQVTDNVCSLANKDECISCGS